MINCVHRSACKVPLFFLDSKETWIFLTYFRKISNIIFHENPSIWIRVVPCRRTDVTKLIVAFRNIAVAPNIGMSNVHSDHFLSSEYDKEFIIPRVGGGISWPAEVVWLSSGRLCCSSVSRYHEAKDRDKPKCSFNTIMFGLDTWWRALRKKGRCGCLWWAVEGTGSDRVTVQQVLQDVLFWLWVLLTKSNEKVKINSACSMHEEKRNAYKIHRICENRMVLRVRYNGGTWRCVGYVKICVILWRYLKLCVAMCTYFCK